MSHTYLESHGVRLDVEVQDEALMPAVERILPPGWRASEDFPEDGHFIVSRNGNGTYDVWAEELPIATGVAADVAVHVLDARLRARIAVAARDRTFIHAGAVAIGGRALVLPGPSFAGKSALVAALVAQGADYFSDEFAVLDANGRVHPYPRPLSLRREGQRYGDIASVESLGGSTGAASADVAMIAVVKYVPGSSWAPEVRDEGTGALALLTNAPAARSRPEDTLRAVGRAAAGAGVLTGNRGEAAEAARALLAALGG